MKKIPNKQQLEIIFQPVKTKREAPVTKAGRRQVADSKKLRRLTIQPGNYPRHKAASLKLQGNWLKSAEFKPGDRVQVEVSNGRLIITKVK